MSRYFRRIYEYWLAFGHAIGAVMTPVQLLLVYGVVFGSARLGTVLARKDLLDRRFLPRPSFWRKRPIEPPTLESARHQF
ncbi:MAG: hypothetical protein ACREAA_08575 [Candidatus Polarisedimenticolia bacterium]